MRTTRAWAGGVEHLALPCVEVGAIPLVAPAAHQGAAVQAILFGGREGVLRIHLHAHSGNVVGVRLHGDGLVHFALVGQLYSLAAGIGGIGQRDRAFSLPAI